MEDATVVFAWAASATGILGFLSTVIQQVLFYKRDSKTMDRIEMGVFSGHSDLNDRMEREHGVLNDRMEREHRELDERMELENEKLQKLVSMGDDKILSAITDVDKRLIQEFAEQKAKQTFLTGKESEILHSIDNLKSFADIMTNLRKENVELKDQNQKLVIENVLLQEKMKELGQQRSSLQDVQRPEIQDIDREPEL